MTLLRKSRTSSKKHRANNNNNNSTPASSSIDPQRHPHAAGIDIGAEELVAAVPPGSTTGPLVRTFSSFTRGVEELRDWLLACGVKTAAMEPKPPGGAEADCDEGAAPQG